MSGKDNKIFEEENVDGSEMKIKIVTMTGTAAEVDVRTNDSVQHLKEKIFNALHISPEIQRITYKGKVLEHGLLTEYDIKDGSSLILSLVMKAGTASATKRSLNIDQKSVSEIIKSLPQDQLNALLSQKKPVTITAKIGDHVVVFTLVPSDYQESPEKEPSSSQHHHQHQQQQCNHSHHHHQSSQSRIMKSSHQHLLTTEEPTNLADKVDLIRKRLSSIREMEEESARRDPERLESVQDGRIRKIKKPLNRFRKSRSIFKKISSLKEKMESSHQNRSSNAKHASNNVEEPEFQTANCDNSIKSVDQENIMDRDPFVSEPSTPLPESVSSDVLFSSPSGPIVPCLKCTKCSKKLKPTKSFTCRCGLVFCIDHRHQNLNLNSEKGHNCTFDFKTQGREELRASNPLIQGPKIQHI